MAQASVPSHFGRGIDLALGAAGPPDLAAAREAFAAGVAEGDARAAHSLASFLAGGIGGLRDWSGAVELLRALAPRDGLAANQVDLISAMELTEDGLPVSTPELSNRHPTKRIAFAEGFLTPQECDFLIRFSEPRLQAAKIVSPENQVEARPAVRDNEHFGFPMIQEPPAVRAINLRIAATTGTDVLQGEPLQIMRYRQGQQYRTHLDRIVAGTNQRLMTAIVYLNEDYLGGETAFPALGLTVRGRRGDMLLWGNLTDAGEVDREMRHAGLPPTQGEKYIASRWILQRPAYDEEGNQLRESIWS